MSITSTLSSLLRSRIPNMLMKNCALMPRLSIKAYHSFLGGSSSLIGDWKLTNQFLLPSPLFFVPERGLKYKGRVRRRCKDCYYVVRDERMYVMCKTHPRHKQAGLKKKEKYTWILTHATQSPIRPW